LGGEHQQGDARTARAAFEQTFENLRYTLAYLGAFSGGATCARCN
jgi:hypothetical protein